MSPAERARIPKPFPASGPSMSMEQVQQLASNPVPMLIGAALAQLVPQFLHMRLSLFRTDTAPGFITSDAPCVIFDPEAHKRPFPYNAPGLTFPSVQITMPVSPTHLACLTHNKLNPLDPLPPAMVNDLNRLTRGHADQNFVVSRNYTDEVWYDLGRPPENDDSPPTR